MSDQISAYREQLLPIAIDRVTSAHTDSYNMCVQKWIPEIVTQYGRLFFKEGSFEYSYQFTSCFFKLPQMSVDHCYTTNTTFSAGLFAEVQEKIRRTEPTQPPDLLKCPSAPSLPPPLKKRTGKGGTPVAVSAGVDGEPGVSTGSRTKKRKFTKTPLDSGSEEEEDLSEPNSFEDLVEGPDNGEENNGSGSEEAIVDQSTGEEIGDDEDMWGDEAEGEDDDGAELSGDWTGDDDVLDPQDDEQQGCSPDNMETAVETPTMRSEQGDTIDDRVLLERARCREMDRSQLLPATHTEYSGPYTVEKKKVIKLCDFPVMLLSSLHTEQQGETRSWGGEFVVSGKKRFIPFIRTIMNNFPYLFYNKMKAQHYVQYRAEHVNSKRFRSTSTIEMYVDTRFQKHHTETVLSIPFLKAPVPLGVVLNCLGLNHSEIQALLRFTFGSRLLDSYFRAHFNQMVESVLGYSPSSARGYIARFYKQSVNIDRTVIDNEILPNLNCSPNRNFDKACTLAHFFLLLLRFRRGELAATDRDAEEYCRLVPSGSSLAVLFRSSFIQYTKDCYQAIRRVMKTSDEAEYPPTGVELAKVFNNERLTRAVNSAMATGVWSPKRKGISQFLITNNVYAVISQLRKITSSFLNNNGKHTLPRMLQTGQYGYVCAAETPEGEGCGLINSLACTSRITLEQGERETADVIQSSLSSLDLIDPVGTTLESDSYLVTDTCGNLYGYTTKIKQVVNHLSYMRQNAEVCPTMTYMLDRSTQTLTVCLDTGRLVRPLVLAEKVLEVSQGLVGITPRQKLVHAGKTIVFVSSPEEKNYSVCRDIGQFHHLTPHYTHLELTDLSFVGILACLAPFFRHNQGPRLAYWINMSKQVISSRSAETHAVSQHRLWYGQKPLVTTRVASHLNLDREPDVVNCQLLLYPCSYNQEDALVMNKAAVERGMFISDTIKTYETSVVVPSNFVSEEKIELPDRSVTMNIKHADYSKLQSNGLPSVGTVLGPGDVCIGKTVPNKRLRHPNMTKTPKNFETFTRLDKSVQLGPTESGVVHSVKQFRKDEMLTVRVAIRTVRIPEVGDKFSSRHSQKVNTLPLPPLFFFFFFVFVFFFFIIIIFPLIVVSLFISV